MFHYVAERDIGNLKRKSNFSRDKHYASHCQQSSSKGYGQPWDRGHLVPANHLDHLPKGIAQSNYMVNILPQHNVLNRGAWLLTEEITECVRDVEVLHVTGGALWEGSGGGGGGGEWLRKHSVEVPSAFWKVILAPESGRMIAWIMPNTEHTKRRALDGFLVTVAEVERRAGQTIALPESKAWRGKGERLKKSKPSKSWKIPKGCDKS